MPILILFKVKNRTKFTGAIVGYENDPYTHYKVSCFKNGRKYLREPNYHERKMIHKYVTEHIAIALKAEKAFYLGVKS